jgi:UDP-galactopyranose mutase
MSQSFDFVVFSHLRWDFVFQRPQHLLSRFAKGNRVIFIEEPVYDEGPVRWEYRTSASNVIVCRLHTAINTPGFSDPQLSAISRMMPDLMGKLDLRNYVAWFYTPMALPLLHDIAPSAVIYDCMDELSAFLGAPKELIDREERLLKIADLVFTGGPSLYRAKQHRSPNVYCFPSSVDAHHYAKARPGGNHEAEDQRALPKSRIGYFGVIDERIDIELLDKLATARPDWQIVMVGPIVKIDRASLPSHPNIHYMGQRSYDELPSYLVGWDVCMLPFARNESTRFISPTKTLEYMAAERMIVSTPITDVAEPYGKIVYLAGTAEEFAAACERAMNATRAEKNERILGMREVLSKTSWDNTAGQMLALIGKAMGKPARRQPMTMVAAKMGRGPIERTGRLAS